MSKDLTQLEISRLTEVYNLTDGHAHRPLDENEGQIVSKLSELFLGSEREGQTGIEDAYLTAFYSLTGQTIDKRKTQYLMLPSASISLEIVANYLRLHRLSLALTEPCFDNLANIFVRHDINLEPIPDSFMELKDWGGALDSLKSESICIVSPNNPTGKTFSQDNFHYLVNYCKRTNKLLILDSSFRAYRSPSDSFDDYRILQDSGIDFIIVEDTGKTWPTKELKTSILAMSESVYKDIYDIYTDFIYHHSPFVLKLLTKFIENSNNDRLHSVREVIDTNRGLLYDAIKGTILSPTEKPIASVAWLKISNNLTAKDVVAMLSQKGVHVLPGNYFFWSDKSLGDKFIRVALVRDPKMFSRAAELIRSSLVKIDMT